MTGLRSLFGGGTSDAAAGGGGGDGSGSGDGGGLKNGSGGGGAVGELDSIVVNERVDVEWVGSNDYHAQLRMAMETGGMA
jgi:hypothetical protein